MEITKPESHEKVWGEEKWIANYDYCGKIMLLKKGFRCSIHHHKVKDETFYVLEGKMLIEVGDEKAVMNEGDVIRIKPGEKHRFSAIEDTRFLEFSTHHDEEDSYRDSQSGEFDVEELIKELNEEGVEV